MEKYIIPKIEIIEFENEDIITTSIDGPIILPDIPIKQNSQYDGN